MSDDELIKRFEELEAGRILGDLDEAEIREWNELSRAPRCRVDHSLEQVAAAMEAEFASLDPLPVGLLDKLHHGKPSFVVPESKLPADSAAPVIVIHPSGWREVFSNPRVAWGIAALFAIFLVAQTLVMTTPKRTPDEFLMIPTKPPAAESLVRLVGKAKDLYRSEFGGLGAYEPMWGAVVWSDEFQEGYLTLKNLPANDPQSRQYQLWIVDPKRDEKPVDGGVFDIPKGEDSVVVPIRNAVAVQDPKAFVITLEQPGGVVVSKQETVVALAGAL